MVKNESNFNLVMRNFESAEEYLNGLGVDVYAITLAKFVLCYDWLKNCLNRENKIRFNINNSDCDICQKFPSGVCRQHRSIYRVLKCSDPLYISDLGFYLYKNEIFKIIDDKVIIVYCSHTKLIKDQITEKKVKKVMPITLQIQKGELFPDIKPKATITSDELLDHNFSCWFNDTFTMLIDRNKDNKSVWSLILNKVE